VLQMALARCFRYGADIAKIAVRCDSPQDAARIEALYSIVLEDLPSLEGRLIAFGMGEAGRGSRIECLRRGAPFSYAALSEEEASAPGQWTAEDMRRAVYGEFKGYHAEGLRMPASKSFAQRAIIAAALAEGRSVLSGYSPCGDSQAALDAARQIGAQVEENAQAAYEKLASMVSAEIYGEEAVKAYADGGAAYCCAFTQGLGKLEIDGAKSVIKGYDANGKELLDKEELISVIENSKDGVIHFEGRRDDKEFSSDVSAVCDKETGKNKIGIWVRDSTQGIGTITYIDKKTAHRADGAAV